MDAFVATTVTSICASNANNDVLVSASRDHTCLVWNLKAGEPLDDPSLVMSCGVPKRVLKGHSHIVEDVCLTYDGEYALTALGMELLVCGTWRVVSRDRL